MNPQEQWLSKAVAYSRPLTVLKGCHSTEKGCFQCLQAEWIGWGHAWDENVFQRCAAWNLALRTIDRKHNWGTLRGKFQETRSSRQDPLGTPQARRPRDGWVWARAPRSRGSPSGRTPQPGRCGFHSSCPQPSTRFPPRWNSLFWALPKRRPAPPAGPALREEGASAPSDPTTRGSHTPKPGARRWEISPPPRLGPSLSRKRCRLALVDLNPQGPGPEGARWWIAVPCALWCWRAVILIPHPESLQ